MADLTSRVADGSDIELKLRGLERLRLAGILDESRFQAMRAALLAAAPAASATAPAAAAPSASAPAPAPAVAPPGPSLPALAPAATPPPPPWTAPGAPTPWSQGPPPGPHPAAGWRRRPLLVGLASVVAVAVVAGTGGMVLARRASSSATTGTAAGDQARQSAIDDALAHPADAGTGGGLLGGLGAGPVPSPAAAPGSAPVAAAGPSADVVLAVDSLPRGADLGSLWGPEYGYSSGAAATLSPGCLPTAVSSTDVAYAQSTFDYAPKANGTTGGYLQVQTIALTSTGAAAPAQAAVGTPQFATCKGAELRSAFAADHPSLTQTGNAAVTTTAETISGLRVTHLHVVIPVTSQGKRSSEVADVYYTAVGRVRITGRFVSCPCTEMPAADRTAAMTVILRHALAARP